MPRLKGSRAWNKGINKGLDFLLLHTSTKDLACIIWPFSLQGHLYGAVSDENGNRTTAHRLMCRLAHGEPPALDYNALHSCNVSYCVNPNHLRWGTQKENNQDMVNAGHAGRGGNRLPHTYAMGEKSINAKLTLEDVEMIRTWHKEGKLNYQDLAVIFNVDKSTIRMVVLNRTWKERKQLCV